MAAKVLVVDDDEVACEALAELLQNAGYEALTATEFHEARTKLIDQPPDVVIVDIRLGPYNGLQLVIEAASVPAIVVSGYPDPTLEAEARKAGAEFMIKPIDPTGLLEMIERRLKDVHTP
jgi:two-component system, NtrC family, response regulator HydG